MILKDDKYYKIRSLRFNSNGKNARVVIYEYDSLLHTINDIDGKLFKNENGYKLNDKDFPFADKEHEDYMYPCYMKLLDKYKDFKDGVYINQW